MIVRPCLIAPLAVVAALAGCTPRGEDANRRILSAHNLIRHAGYGGLGPISSGEVARGESHQLRATLANGTCYVLAVFGSPGLDDVSVTVTAPDGSPAAEDRSVGPTGVVSFCAEQGGEHQVSVTAAAGAGAFQMAYWFRSGQGGEPLPVAAGGGSEIVLGRPVTGVLLPGQPFIDYSMRVDRPRTVTIDLMSEEFDCYLYLRRNGSELVSDDDGGSGLNSRISRHLEGGSYTIRVGSFMNSGSGRFTLSAR